MHKFEWDSFRHSDKTSYFQLLKVIILLLSFYHRGATFSKKNHLPYIRSNIIFLMSYWFWWCHFSLKWNSAKKFWEKRACSPQVKFRYLTRNLCFKMTWIKDHKSNQDNLTTNFFHYLKKNISKKELTNLSLHNVYRIFRLMAN